MITFLIGHRGSGKTSLLPRIESYLGTGGGAVTIDLDQFIEQTEKKSISEIFASRGEDVFRALEQNAVQRILTEHEKSKIEVFVATGAGFHGPQLVRGRCLWIRRPTDARGRIFVDRPRLDLAKDPLQEYVERYGERQPRYRSWADEELTVPEGFDVPNDWERSYFSGNVDAAGAIVTLQPELFAHERRLDAYFKRREGWNLRFELRDDLLSSEKLLVALKKVAPERLVFSLRKDAKQTAFARKLKTGSLWDWPGEWPLQPGLQPSILSLHERASGQSFEAAARKLEKLARTTGTLLKLAIEVRDLEELKQGHDWAMEDAKHRAFLPRSVDGRWGWYRLLTKGRFPLAYLRDGDGSAPDQPYLLEWLRALPSPQTFAAVLGDPILHSFTPAEHDAFFRARGMPVFAIPISEQQWEEGALEILRKFGLRAAAVTAPLKTLAARAATKKTAEAERLATVNTLHDLTGAGTWRGTNTDLAGVQALAREAAGDVAIWGGGGTLPILKETFPQARFYSARTGSPREEKPVGPFSPRTVVWGVGRSRQAEEGWPNPAWKPEIVLDLNYTEDSPGREYAVRVGARYVSGLAMFRRQAEEQRKFWES